MSKPIVAVVGRPNVGKSTLFNQIGGRRISIVDDIPGVTRDRIYTEAEWLGRKFTLVDTGGFEPFSQEDIPQQIRQQAGIAIDTADVIVFVVDGQQGLTTDDIEVAAILRKTEKPVVLAVNKLDSTSLHDARYEFYKLGIGEPLIVSAVHKHGLGDLLDSVIEHFDSQSMDEQTADSIKIAVVGKPNSGKSSLVNRILGEQRVIVSDVPGTTRDAVDTTFTFEGRDYTIIDTAGIRKKSKIDESLEYYSVLRAMSAINRCDVALIVIDASEGITEQPVKIAGLVHEEGKPSILVMNKWDLIEKDTHTINEYRKKIMEHFSYMDYAPSLFISAKSGLRVNKTIEMVDAVYAQYGKRITTGIFGKCLYEATAANQPPSHRGRELKIYYGTQVSVKPPTFVLFVNDAELMHFSYLRYLENYFRKTLGMENVPVRIVLRERSK
jgi:GTP-binding protein